MLLIALLGVLTLAPLTASRTATAAAAAAPARTAPHAVPLTGTLPNGGHFVGTFNLQNFVAEQGHLVAQGTLTGTLTDALGQVLGTVTNQPVSLPVSASGSCVILHLTLGPLDLNLLGLIVHLNQVVLNIDAQSGSGQLLGNLLCAVAHLLDGGSPLVGLTNRLNHLLGQLFPTLPVTGTTADGGQFVGALTLQHISAAPAGAAPQPGGLLVTGLLSGTLVNSLGQVVGSIVNQLVTLPLAAAGSCAILHLTLGPLDLNLLGLAVHLNQVVLNIDAQAGPGNLLGHLLCAVASLLDSGGPLDQIAALLNRILTLL